MFPNLLGAEAAVNANNINSMFSGIETARQGLLPDVWRTFMENHSSPEFYRQVIALIGDHIRLRYPDLENRLGKPLEEFTVAWRKDENDADVQIDCQFAMNTPVQIPSRVRGVHVDNPKKLYNALLYMRLDEDETAGGNLGIYQFKDKPRFDGVQVPDEAVDEVGTLPYKANSVVLLMNSPEALHGVTVREVTPCPRRYINFLAELREPLFDLKPYQESGRISISIPKSGPARQRQSKPKPKPNHEDNMSPLRIFIGFDERQIPASSALIQRGDILSS